MFTSDVRPGDVLRRRTAGLSGYAVKPVARFELFRLICTAIQPIESERQGLPEGVNREVAAGRPLNILIAEDSADNRLLVRAYLKGSSHKLQFAEDGRSAVDQFAAGSFVSFL
jgi:CheY-like chemotaxis protein